jgi:hypothetical protein
VRVVVVGRGRLGAALAAGQALTTLQAEPDLRRRLGGQPGGSHTPAG